jgi:type II secretory pathway component PulL
MATFFLGIQICNNAINATVVSSESRQLSLLGTYRVGIESPAEETPPLTQLCEHIASDHDLTNMQCAVSIPASHAYYRVLDVPFKDDNKVRQILPYELEPLLPEPVNQLTFDYTFVSADGVGKILAVAVKTDVLTSINDALAVHKLRPSVLTIDGLPIIQALLVLQDTPQDFLFLTGDEDACLMAAICAGNLCGMRIIPVTKGGFGDIKAFCRNICLTHIGLREQARDGFDPAGLLAFLSEKRFAVLNKALSSEFHIPIRKIDSIMSQTHQIANIPSKSQQRQWIQNPLAVTLAGLERRKPFINFSHQKSPLRHFWDEHKQKLLVPITLLTVLIVLALAGVIYQSTTLQKRIDLLDSQINAILSEAFPEVTTIVDPVQQMQMHLRELEQNTAGGFTTSDQPLMIDLLRSISEAIAPDTDAVFTRLVIGRGDIIISGTTDTYNSVDAIKNRLQGIAAIKTVVTTSADKEKRGNRIRFRFKIGLVAP